MLRNYLKTALRGLRQQKGYALINVFGLAVGIACCLLILLYVRSEWTHDAFHEHADRIYRVNATWQADGSLERWSDTPIPLAPALAETFPDVAYATGVYPSYTTLQVEQRTAYELATYVNADFFQVFSFPFVAGDPATAFPHPNTVVLTRSVATNYFGDADPVGRDVLVKLDAGFEPFTVTGVIADPPETSSLYLALILPMEGIERIPYGEGLLTNWHAQAATFVRLRPTASALDLEAQLPRLVDRFKEPLLQDREALRYTLQPLAEIYFDTSWNTRGITATSDPTSSYVLASIALLILLVACANFTTLAVAQSSRRLKEIGVRKVLGAGRLRLVRQFLGEAFVTAFLALVLGVALAELFLPTFNRLAERPLAFGYATYASTGLLLFGLMLGTGLLAGSYPALYLSRLRPGMLLRDRTVTRGRNRLIRVLVLAQFTLSVGLLVGTLVMSRQLAFMARYDLGLTTDDVLIVEPDFTSNQTHPRLYARLTAEQAGQSGVLHVARSSGMIGRSYSHLPLKTGNRDVDAYQWLVSPSYVDVFGLTLRDGQPLRAGAEHDVIVNETLVAELGWAPGTAVGRTLPGQEGYRVAGVAADFHFQSLRNRIRPLVLRVMPDDYPGGMLALKVAPGRRQAALDLVRRAWADAAPGVPLLTYDLGDDLRSAYADDRAWRRIFSYAAGFALFIACLGLLGLSALTAARRTKEIGIRKAMGATVSDLVLLLSRGFAGLVAAAVVLASLLSYVVVQRWLETFVFRVDLRGGDFFSAGLAALGLALLTVGYQAIRAARANPVDSLRDE